jgi:hypothetical protein
LLHSKRSWLPKTIVTLTVGKTQTYISQLKTILNEILEEEVLRGTFERKRSERNACCVFRVKYDPFGVVNVIVL